MLVPRHCDFLRCLRRRHRSRRRLPEIPLQPSLAVSSSYLRLSSRKLFPLQPAPGFWEKAAGVGGSSTPRWRASSPSARLSPPPANVKVCRYRVLASPRKVPLQSADSGSLLENASSPAPTCRARTHLGLLLTGTHDATAACLGKALRRATLHRSPPSRARDSLKLILAKPPLQVAANDGFSQPNAIFTRQYPEITSSLERANCHFSCRGKSRRPT